MTLDLQIKRLRTEKGLTQQDLAEMVGVSKPHISEVERGVKNLNNHLIERISAALEVHPAELFGGGAVESWGKVQHAMSSLSESDRQRLLAYAEGLLDSQAGGKS